LEQNRPKTHTTAGYNFSDIGPCMCVCVLTVLEMEILLCYIEYV